VLDRNDLTTTPLRQLEISCLWDTLEADFCIDTGGINQLHDSQKIACQASSELIRICF
jgi:hypothetical protein